MRGSGWTIGGSDVTDRNVFIKGALGDANGKMIAVNGSNHTIQNNYIGVESDGTTTNAERDGIMLHGGAGAVSDLLIKDNVIANLAGCAIQINTAAGAVTLEGNNIGFGADGTTPLIAEGWYGGICDQDGDTHTGLVTIGGDTATERNLIGDAAGINLMATYTGGFLIEGNYIGTNAAGTASIQNGTGIILDGACSGGPGCIIGGDIAGERNVISGNEGAGISITTDGSGWQIQNNYIGMDSTGAAALANGTDGIYITGAANNIIIGETGSTVSTYNVIAGNGGNGIDFSTATGTYTVNGNYIGLDATGDNASSNGSHHIEITGAPDLTIGHMDATSPTNVIAGGGGTYRGISVFNVGPSATLNIYSTILGLVADQSTTADPDGATGGPLIVIDQMQSGSMMMIGNTRTAGFNVIAGGDGDGINVNGSLNGSELTITGNFIGISSDQATVIGNSGDGIDVFSGGVVIGGTGTGTGNVIGGQSNQIRIGSGVDGTEIYRNYLGMTTTGADIAGSQNGITDEGSTDLTMGGGVTGGGGAPTAGNYISGPGLL